MTDTDDTRSLAERAREAYERTLADHGPAEPVDLITLAQLERAVSSLRRKDRAVFLAHRCDGLSYVEIAAQTGLSDQAIRQCMARALYEIARFMDGEPVRRWRFWPFL